jgi:hypothetical protein
MPSYQRTTANDARKVRQLASATGLVSYMNDRKWSAAYSIFSGWCYPPPRFRVFDLLAPRGEPTWSRQWYHTRLPHVSIKCMEVQLPPDELRRVVETYTGGRLPIEVIETGVRIWGWMGSDDRPKLI